MRRVAHARREAALHGGEEHGRSGGQIQAHDLRGDACIHARAAMAQMVVRVSGGDGNVQDVTGGDPGIETHGAGERQAPWIDVRARAA